MRYESEGLPAADLTGPDVLSKLVREGEMMMTTFQPLVIILPYKN